MKKTNQNIFNRLIRFIASKRSNSNPKPLLDEFDLDRVLIKFGEGNELTIRHFFAGICAFGTIGSGKTSGIGKTAAKAMLKEGFGGLVLTAKGEELDLWKQYVKETGREDDLIVVEEDGDYRFNFLDYELTREGKGAGKTENLVALFMIISEMGDGASGSTDSSDAFWKQSLKELLTNTIDTCKLSGTELTIHNIFKVINDAASSIEQVGDEAWQQSSFNYQALYEIGEKELSEEEAEIYEILLDYWFKSYPQFDEKTRSIVKASFTGISNSFIRGPLKKLFSTDTTLTPEVIFEGKIVIFDLSVMQYGPLGTYAQCIFKYMYQRAAERRDVNLNPRPTFLYADEVQYFLNSFDSEFQTTARGYRVATVFLTQNISNIYSVIKGQNSKSRADSLMANLSTKIFNKNNDSVTNNWAADLIGKDWNNRMNLSNSRSGRGGNIGMNEDLQHLVQPREFGELKNGGPENNFLVESIISSAARGPWSNGKGFIKVSFNQKS